MEAFQHLLFGLSVALQPSNFIYAVIGCVLGTTVGVLPGIGPLATVSILLPGTFGLDATKAIILLGAVYYVAMYGGSTTSILMRIPGEVASIVTCLDGYAMTQKGRAGPALVISAVGSFIAGTLSLLGIMLLAPPLANFALRFGPPEYTALLVLGLMVLGYMSGGPMLKTLAMAVLGLLLGMIGLDPITGYLRSTYDIAELADGIGIIPVAVGLFGLAEILTTVAGQEAPPQVVKPRLRDLPPSREEWRDSIGPIGRGTVLGFLIGVLPGPGHIISTFASYAVERRLSKHP
jgi:putative tricarboxylic transport membrane protein